MSIEIKVPELPESIADAVVVNWYKKQGDSIKQDEALVDLETDKVVLEVPAISSGVIEKIFFAEGSVVTAGQVLAIIDETAEVSDKINDDAPVVAASKAVAAKNTAEIVSDVAISPSARKMMHEQGIDASMVKGSGKHGRILKEDIQRFINNKNEPVEAEEPAGAITKKPLEVESTVQTGQRIEKRVPMTRLRARIAERLVQAQQNAAILTTFNEVNMKPVMDLRVRHKEKFQKEYNIKLGFMSFFVKASLEALKKFPAVNASIDGNDIVYHGYYDIGVAVSGPSGLVVPVVRNAEELSMAEIEQGIVDYAVKARENKLSLEEITGGTFTISNGGVFGSMLSTPILNPPQSAILGMHTIKERAMVVDGEVVILPMMYLALSYDHRIIDGREAVQFLVTIKDMLEDPSRMLLGI
ncbi:MAG: 2-oxoglutarate dehydrogenase complex dihydrolipoyllysine-residue succinyltransferase [Gammaproteobacteria bacterium]|nr:2-oxoglutarate dehydrogenase complex dihydrolipoyllysine-residue succinyltransferase [Gammaproteobacteria bacterium]MCW8923023.1 2-oxoglutarate dehydrogenase complex dihydrolipoyllysine-residue succinyltransferase [Gammaproteobacteria bacterium]